MKGKTIGYFKNVQNVPYCKAKTDMKVANGVILDRVNNVAALPTTVDEAKTVKYIVSNINDKPEIHNTPETFVVKKGEYVRADDLHTVNGLEIEFADFEITDELSQLAVGDYLVFGADGVLCKTTDIKGYAAAFKIIKKTAYMDGGVLCEIVCK